MVGVVTCMSYRSPGEGGGCGHMHVVQTPSQMKVVGMVTCMSYRPPGEGGGRAC